MLTYARRAVVESGFISILFCCYSVEAQIFWNFDDNFGVWEQVEREKFPFAIHVAENNAASIAIFIDDVHLRRRHARQRILPKKL